MPTLYREKLQLVCMKIETTPGVDAVPTGANAIQSKGVPEINLGYLDIGDRGDVQTSIMSAADDAAPSGRMASFDITVELRGPGATISNTVRPNADVLLRISDLGATVDTTPGSENIRYTTLDQGTETATAYCFFAGKRVILVGCKAQPKLGAELYKAGTMSFIVTGKVAADPTETAMLVPTFPQVPPPSFHSFAASIVGVYSWLSTDATNPFLLLSASIDFGNVVSDIGGAGAPDGLVAYLITDRAPTQELTFYAGPLSVFDPFNASKLDGFAGAHVTSWGLGTIQYNKIKVEARWRPRAPRAGNRNGAKTFTVSGPCRVASGILSGNREIQITFQ